MIHRAVDWIMYHLGFVPIREYIHLFARMEAFKDAASEVQDAHVELIERLNTFSASLYGAPLDNDQAKYLAAMMRQQGATEARAERMAQVFDLDAFRTARKNDENG